MPPAVGVATGEVGWFYELQSYGNNNKGRKTGRQQGLNMQAVRHVQKHSKDCYLFVLERHAFMWFFKPKVFLWWLLISTPG